jgi:hypothetical protein
MPPCPRKGSIILSNRRRYLTIMTKPIPDKKEEIIDGYTIKYHANGITIWS